MSAQPPWVNITVRCPSCGRKFARMTGHAYATSVRRTCQGCREQWQVTVKPMATGDGWRADEVTLAFRGRALAALKGGE